MNVKSESDSILTVAQKLGMRGAARWAFRGDCVLCLEEAGTGLVCQNCERFLAEPRSRCPRCAIPVADGGWCGGCLREPPRFDDIVTAFDYRFPVDRLVRRFKFSADLALGAYLGDALAAAVASVARPDVVVASPSSPARLRERGFDPALLLARRVRARLGLRLDAGSLAKMRHTPPQAGLDRGERQRNLRGAFTIRRSLAGLHVAVVDDVMTTGATLAELAGVLKEAGARRVSGWVAARTPEPGP
jgi:ComF family protein